MTYDEFKQNFLPEFLKIKSFAGKIKYAKEHLAQIGSGTGRIVYDIDGEKVLKLAKNSKGVAQNEAEAGAGYYRDTQHIVAEVFDSGDDDSWLIAEKAKKVNEARIKQLTGIPSLYELWKYLKNFHSSNNGKGNTFSQDREIIDQLNNNEFAQDLQNFVADYNQQPGDYGRPSTYGEVLHDGQPSIVLTDYGLNDEVYDTHYAPKKQRMYEMYNFADGNDDILSDMPGQDAVDTRQGMWGLMPYSVGDGPGVINEEFLSFVENRDKYPQEGVLPSTPYILDEFHNVVNNLREALDHVQDKKKFYNNLLELQDYLIRGKFWDREPLGKEVLTESPVATSKLSDGQSDKFADDLATKLNLGAPQPLGPGGGNGKAYLINNNRVLKITIDPCEVDAAGKTNAVHPKTLVFTHKIYKLIDTETGVEVYALINDNIANKPYDDFERYKVIISSLDATGEDSMFEKLLSILVRGKSKAPEFLGKTLEDFPELAQLILANKPEANINQADRQKAYQYMMGLYEIRKELLQLGIKSTDFYVSSNIGYKDGILTFFDIGGCRAPEPNIPEENIIRLPEGKETLTENELNEEVLGFPKDVADRIANEVSRKYNYGQPNFLDYGVFGYAYDIGNNMILKVTKDQSEANENLELIGKPLKYIAEPYKVFSIKSKLTDKELYVIILEKLNTNDKSTFIAMVERMKFAFEKIMGANYGDVLDHYIHGAQPYDEVDEEKVEKYFARNPKDKEFFDKILKIGEEVKKYGLETTDYTNPKNLGYKPDGTLGFFDVGFGNYFFKSGNKPEEVQVDEDGSAKFSTPNSFGQDDFPPYDNNDTSPLTDNNVPTTVDTSIDEDLEYNHVVGDATQDEFQITERVKSFQPGSQSVEVKQKCRLAGNGNTSTACNQGDINNLNIKPITEEIHAKEVGGNFDKALKTVINGKRDLCFIDLTPERYKLVQKNGLHSIPVRMTSQNSMMAIVYRDATKAQRLYDIAKSHQGYLNDKTPEEAREIGQLLGYKEASIEEYIHKNQHRYGRQIPRAPEPEDFNDMDEQEFTLPEKNSGNNDIVAALEDLERARSVKYWMEPEFSAESRKYPQEGEPNSFMESEKQGTLMGNEPKEQRLWQSKDIVAYDENGKIVGVFSIAISGPEKGAFKISTRKDAQRMGWGTKLLNRAEASGIDIVNNVKYNSFSSSGRDLLRSWLRNKLTTTLNENDFDNYEKDIEQDNTMHQLDKKLIRTYNDGIDINPVYAVNGDEVRDSGFIEWVEGGNHWVDADLPKSQQKYAKNIPEDELWVDDVHLTKPNDFEAILLHERTESFLIKHYGYSYDDAHDVANRIELVFREKTHDISDEEESQRIAALYFASFKKHLKTKKKFVNREKNLKENSIFAENNQMNEAQIMSIQNLPFRQEVEKLGGQIYAVGGSVRDEFLGLVSKDLDIIIRGIPEDQLVKILAKYGTVNPVGKSFAVMKFKPTGSSEDIDIALPRTEVSTGEGHKDFIITADHTLPIEKDLERRDFTINAIAKDMQGNVIDPFNGREDLKSKVIRVTHPKSFSDDPLRMLRAVQFASRFGGFEIDPETYQMIRDNARMIRTVAKDRTQEELSKIIEKGDPEKGAFLLQDTGLLKEMGADAPLSTSDDWKDVKTLAEYVYLLSHNSSMSPVEFYKRNFRGDVEIINEIQGLLVGMNTPPSNNPVTNRAIAHNMVVTSKGIKVLESKLLPPQLQVAAQELLSGKYPKTENDMAANGDDLKAIGYVEGKELGTMKKAMLLKIYSDGIKNDKEALLDFAKQRNPGDVSGIKESLADKAAERMFNIPNQSAQQDVQARGAIQAQEEQPIAMVSGPGDRKKTPIYENPRSLQNFDTNVRGIIDWEGNIFVAQYDGNFNHGRMGIAMDFMDSDTDAMYKHLTEYMLIIRIGDTNAFGLADSSYDFAQDEYDYENAKIVADFLRAAKRKNPQYDFYNEYYEDAKGEPVSLTEFSYAGIRPEEQEPTWDVNGQQVGVDFFADKYYEWNQGGYEYASTNSVLEFLQNNYEDFSHDERLKHDLYHKLVDNEVLDEAKKKTELEPIEPFEFDPSTVSDSKWQVITNALTKIGYSPRPYTDWKNYFNKIGTTTIPTASIDDDKTRIIKKVFTPRAPMSDDTKLIAKAKRYFGTTGNFKEAGYLLQDGSMLNFSGAKFGGSPNRRDIDHRQVGEIGSDMVSFMKMGNIRLQSNGFEMTKMPTKQQFNTLWQYIRQTTDYIIVDFATEDGNNVEHSVEYPKGTNANRIINDIANYYNNGTKPIAPFIREDVNNKVRYTAVVLDDKSRAALLTRLGNMIPEGWETIAHHMTMNLGPIAPEYQKFLGMTVVMEAVEFAADDKVMAVGVKVDEYLTKNAKPHITLAVNRANGGKPMMSNQLTNWEALSEPLILSGKVTEVQ